MNARSRATVPHPIVNADGVVDLAAAPVGPPKPRRRDRVVAIDRGYRYEYLPGDDDAEDKSDGLLERPEVTTAGAGRLGFTGTTAVSNASGPKGLITMTTNGFGNGPAIPMAPGSWHSIG
ncbi:PPW family C-terminal domain-containing PPE protein [Candidatus Mycobacterium wuenschmannii]|nr:hypothetical protein [Candidatus Mycobacterium wuenschmannii]